MFKLFVFFALLISNIAFSQVFIEDFEEKVFPPKAWNADNPFDLIKGVSGVSAYGVGKSSLLVNFYMIKSDTWGSISTPVIEGLTDTNYISFDYSYTRYIGKQGPDSIKIYVSLDSGVTYPLLAAAFELTNMTTAERTYKEFIPTSKQWTKLEAALPEQIYGNKCSIKFYFKSSYGNNLYIDNIAVR